MKKFALLIALFSMIVSCSSDDSGDGTGGITDSPVSGKLYGQDFNLGGGKASIDEFFGEEMIEIWLTSENLGCETPGLSGFPISIYVPKAEGTHTSGVSVTYRDTESSDYISLATGNTVEIISLTETQVIGKIKSASTTTDNNIEGKFEIEICQ